jgi:hypothetical protein
LAPIDARHDKKQNGDATKEKKKGFSFMIIPKIKYPMRC